MEDLSGIEPEAANDYPPLYQLSYRSVLTGAGEWRAAFHGLAALGAETWRLSALVAQTGLEPVYPIRQAHSSWLLARVALRNFTGRPFLWTESTVRRAASYGLRLR